MKDHRGMGFWDSIEGFEKDRDNRKPGDEPSLLEKIGDFVHDEDNRKVIGYVLELMTDGYLNEDDLGQSDKDDQRQRTKKPGHGDFEERIQRRLAELQEEAAASSASPAAPPEPAPPVAMPAAPLQRPAPRPPLRGPGGFGRKGL